MNATYFVMKLVTTALEIFKQAVDSDSCLQLSIFEF
jgi:hypothetical protein